MNKLLDLRAEIDSVDAELVALFQKRFEIVERVVEIKRADGLAATMPDRIEQVVQNVSRLAADTKVPPQTIEKIWRTLIAETIAFEERRL